MCQKGKWWCSVWCLELWTREKCVLSVQTCCLALKINWISSLKSTFPINERTPSLWKEMMLVLVYNSRTQWNNLWCYVYHLTASPLAPTGCFLWARRQMDMWNKSMDWGEKLNLACRIKRNQDDAFLHLSAGENSSPPPLQWTTGGILSSEEICSPVNGKVNVLNQSHCPH